MIVKTINTTTRILSVLLVLAMLLSCTVLAAETETAENNQVLISLTDADTFEMSFDLSEEDFAAASAEGAAITYTLVRTGTYANPTEDFFPVLDETEMYPNEKDTIDLTKGAGSLSIQNFTSELADGKLNISFTIKPMASRGNPSAPHSNGGSYLDVCGPFELVVAVGEKTIATRDDIMVKPYPTFHTMWEIYDELKRLATLGDNDAETAKPFVSYQVMGQSNLGYDMPYLIVAKNQAAVENWLALCERAETEPEAVKAELETLNYQVPVMYSNIHANEVAAADGVLEFAKMLVEQETISYETLTSLTEAGEARLAEQRKAMGLHTSSLIADQATFLGGIFASDRSQNSAKVEGFDTYYNSEEVELVVDDILDDVFFLLVPEENVEGRMYVTRTSSGGYDLNRDNSFQTQAETQNMQKLIGTYNPVTLLELHGQVTSFQVEPCSPPHEPNVEYDLLGSHLLPGGEAFGAAAVANNDDYQSYAVPMRDYLESDKDGNPYWAAPWDDMSTSYTPQFAMLHGCVAYTVELPAYSEATRTAASYGLAGLTTYVAENKAAYFADQLSIYARGAGNLNSDEKVAPWFVDAADTVGAEAELFRPAREGNGQFFPECYIIPVDATQTNLQAAYDMAEWLTRNDVKVNVTTDAVTIADTTYPAGTLVVSMYQAKRSVANGALYNGTVIRNWSELYSEGITAFNHTRGFDMDTCEDPAAYAEIAKVMGKAYDYASMTAYLADNAKSVFTGETGGDVAILNDSEDAVAAVNTLLRSGETVAMSAETSRFFVCSYDAWLSVADDYVLTGKGILDEPELLADLDLRVLEKAPVVYINGTASAMTPGSSGYVYSRYVSSSSSYHYDRMALEAMGFDMTTDAAEADAIIGASGLDAAGLAAVQAGTPYVGYSNSVVSAVNRNLFSVATKSTSGMDCLGYVTYPNITLTNSSYAELRDNIMYGYGTRYYTTMPEGAVVLVQGDATKAPLEGFLNGSEESLQAFLGGVKGFSYVGPDKNGNEVNVTLFANTLTNKAHQRDEYGFISNTIFANMMTDEAYEMNLPTVTVNMTGTDEVTVDETELTYNLTVEDTYQLATAELTFQVDGENVANAAVEAAEGWQVLSQSFENGVLTAVVFNLKGITSEEAVAMAAVKVTTSGEIGAVTVALTDAKLSAYCGEAEETYVDVAYGETSVTTDVTYSIYDVNQDGTVDQLDITRAQRYFGMTAEDALWNALADVDGSGKVDIQDFILILNNYTV